jgi:transposase
MRYDSSTQTVVGDAGVLLVASDDEVTKKLCMLIEGECEGLGPKKAAARYGFSRQRYTQIRVAFAEQGAKGLMCRQRGPKRNFRRTNEVVRQIIRYRFLDPLCSVDVIAQKLRQTEFKISTRSVARVIAEYGLQKKGFTHADLDPIQMESRRSRSR